MAREGKIYGYSEYYTSGNAARKVERHEFEPQRQPQRAPRQKQREKIEVITRKLTRQEVFRRAVAMFSVLVIALGCLSILINYANLSAQNAALSDVNSTIEDLKGNISELSRDIESGVTKKAVEDYAVANGLIAPGKGN